MNYEQAKELKDAGFPQTGKGVTIIAPDYPKDGTAVAPTLSELIEACAEDFIQLSRIVHTKEAKSGMRWKADAKKTKTTRHNTFGSTPEEAVARLWLALQDKK